MITERVESIPTRRAVKGEMSLYITSDRDIITARQQARSFAEQVGFRQSESAVLATLISDVVRTILILAHGGSVIIQAIEFGGRKGVTICASSNIYEVRRNKSREISPSLNSGRGISRLADIAAKRIIDEFEIAGSIPNAIAVRVVKWL